MLPAFIEFSFSENSIRKKERGGNGQWKSFIELKKWIQEFRTMI
jgi:hypothetical protein